MNIFLNGEKRDVPDGLTVTGLLQHLVIKPERVAVEINEEIVRKATYADKTVKDGDRVEVVQFMGGGAQLRILDCGLDKANTVNRKKSSLFLPLPVDNSIVLLVNRL